MEWNEGEFKVSCDPGKQDLDVIHGFLVQAYWSRNIPRDTLGRSIEGSTCFALLHHERQVGFARVIGDHATFAYLADVFVLPEYRGRGLSKWLMSCVMAHPDLQGLRRWMLATADAHALYEKFGFNVLKEPSIFMERHDPDIYG